MACADGGGTVDQVTTNGEPMILVLYRSTHGHTARIAARVGEVLQEAGVQAQVVDLAEDPSVDPAGFDGVIVGASVHTGRHQHDVLDWITDHLSVLRHRPSAFFSVSLTAADDTDEARVTTHALIDDALEATGWTPRATAAFAGALQFHEYNLPTRVLMRLIARRHDGEVDLHEDTDFTDWADVERFARAFAATVLPRGVAA
jgi:menaquinone-dependent protoporphyrinogen oxidase